MANPRSGNTADGGTGAATITAVAPPTAQVAPPAPVAEQPKGTDLRAYYGGLKATCPLDYLTVPVTAGEGAPTLQKWTQKLMDDGKGIFSLSGKEPGGIIRLFPDEFETICTWVREHGIYWESKGEYKRIQIVPISNPNVRRNRRDTGEGRFEPLAPYVWLVPAQGVSMEQREDSYTPQTLG